MLFSQKAAIKQQKAVNDQKYGKSDLFVGLNRLVVLPDEPSDHNVLNLDEYTLAVNTEGESESDAVGDRVHEVENL